MNVEPGCLLFVCLGGYVGKKVWHTGHQRLITSARDASY